MTEAVDLGSYRNERIRRYESHIRDLSDYFFGVFSDIDIVFEPNNTLSRIAFRLVDQNKKSVSPGIQKDFIEYVTRYCPPELEEFTHLPEGLLQESPLIILEKKRQAD